MSSQDTLDLTTGSAPDLTGPAITVADTDNSATPVPVGATSVSAETPTSTSEHDEPIPTDDELSSIPIGMAIDKNRTFYYRHQYRDTFTFFKIQSWSTADTGFKSGFHSPAHDEKAYNVTYYDHNTKKPETVYNVNRDSIFELKTDRENIEAAVLKQKQAIDAYRASLMEPVKREDIDNKDYKKSYAYYYDGNSYELCRITEIPFRLVGTKLKPITIQKVDPKNPSTPKFNVDISRIFRPTKKVGGGRGKKTKKGGYKHKKSNRKHKYHSRTRKVRKPRNRKGRTYSKRRRN